MKNITSPKFPIALFLLMTLATSAFAKKVPGYIVTNAGDTLVGKVRIPKVNQVTYAWHIFGYDMDSFYEKVSFKGNDDKTFSSYFADDIKGFGFTHNSTDYCYATIHIEHKSLVKSEQSQNRFLYQMHKGQINLYHSLWRELVPQLQSTNEGGIAVYSEYVLQNNIQAPVRVKTTVDGQQLANVLLSLGMDESFVEKVSPILSLQKLKSILEIYDDWLLKRSQPTAPPASDK